MRELVTQTVVVQKLLQRTDQSRQTHTPLHATRLYCLQHRNCSPARCKIKHIQACVQAHDVSEGRGRAGSPKPGRVEPGDVRQRQRKQALQAQQGGAVAALPQRREHAQRAGQRPGQRGLQAARHGRRRRHALHQQRAHLVARVQRAPARVGLRLTQLDLAQTLHA